MSGRRALLCSAVVAVKRAGTEKEGSRPHEKGEERGEHREHRAHRAGDGQLALARTAVAGRQAGWPAGWLAGWLAGRGRRRRAAAAGPHDRDGRARTVRRGGRCAGSALGRTPAATLTETTATCFTRWHGGVAGCDDGVDGTEAPPRLRHGRDVQRRRSRLPLNASASSTACRRPRRAALM